MDFCKEVPSRFVRPFPQMASWSPLADEISADKEQLRLMGALLLSEYNFVLTLLVLNAIVGTQAVEAPRP